MIIPIRCFTCGKVLANKWQAYQEKKEEGVEQKDDDLPMYISNTLHQKILEDLGITKMCCKRIMLTHIDMIGNVKN